MARPVSSLPARRVERKGSEDREWRGRKRMQAYDVMSSGSVNNQVKEGLQEWRGGRSEEVRRR